MQKEFTGRVHALQPGNEDDGEDGRNKSTGSKSMPTDVAPALSELQKSVATIAAIQRKSGRSPARKDSPSRGRSPGRSGRDGKDGRGRSPSNSRRLIDWGDKCYHCGSSAHKRPDCKEFQNMMADHNKSEPNKKKWKTPPGYKSAIAKAHEAAKAAENKTGKLNAINVSDDTASDTLSQAGSFTVTALRPVMKGTPRAKAVIKLQPNGVIDAANKFEARDTPQEHSPEAFASLNEWASKVQRLSTVKMSQRE